MNSVRSRVLSLSVPRAAKVLSLILLSGGLVSATTLSATANDYGNCRGGSYYRGSIGSGYSYANQGYRNNSYRGYGSSCDRGYGRCDDFGARYPILPIDTACWTYRCSLQDYGCEGYYHPEYKCWYYYYPQQRVFIPTQYIADYPPAPRQILNNNDNFNGNQNDNFNDNLNENVNQNRNQNDSTNVTNINIGTGIVPIQSQPQLNRPTTQVDSPPQPELPSRPDQVPPTTVQPLHDGDSSAGQPIPLPPRATSNPLSVAKRN